MTAPALFALLAALVAPSDTGRADSVAGPTVTAAIGAASIPDDTVRRRPRSIEVSDWYERRLRVHRYGSYAMYPLFAVQAIAGNQLYQNSSRRDWVRTAHKTTAIGLGTIFTVNTVTGLWNLWDSRSAEQGRTRRLVHAALMLASDAGLAYAGVRLSEQAKISFEKRREHRQWAYGSMATALAGAGVMVFWKEE